MAGEGWVRRSLHRTRTFSTRDKVSGPSWSEMTWPKVPAKMRTKWGRA